MRIAAVGDVTAFHREPESGYEFAGPVLADFDVVFAQNERLYSRTTALPDVGFTELTDPDHVAALKLGHFDVISFASNHCYDLGPDVFMETRDALRPLPHRRRSRHRVRSMTVASRRQAMLSAHPAAANAAPTVARS
jgi:hypothetical protein